MNLYIAPKNKTIFPFPHPILPIKHNLITLGCYHIKIVIT